MRSSLVIAALLASASIAVAAPKGKAAKAAFDRGVVAYQKQDYAGASAALAESYKLEADVETLFAWAQSERQQNNCEAAIDLYDKLLAMDLPAENKEAVQAKMDECKAIISAKTGKIDKPIEPVEEPIKEPPPKPHADGKKPWWKDPIGDALVAGGVISLGVGGYFLYSAKQAEDASKESNAQFRDEQDKAESRGRIGVIMTIGGAALITGGIVRYVTRSNGGSDKETNVTGWVVPDGGGVAAFGRF
jgi:tetratricopeptide (TPR) repeat protein